MKLYVGVWIIFLIIFPGDNALAGNADREQALFAAGMSSFPKHDDSLSNVVSSDMSEGGKKSSSSSGVNKIAGFIWGDPVSNGIIYLPWGVHTKHSGISNNHLVSVVYNSFLFGTFINSFDDRVWSLAFNRNLIEYHGFGVDYVAGLIYGYEGKLSEVEGIPLKNTFLFKHNLNPVVSINPYYKASEHFQIQTVLTPLVVLFGIKYNF